MMPLVPVECSIVMSMDVQKTMEFILEQQAQTEVHLKAVANELRRAVRLGIKEARQERARRRELASEVDAAITKLAAAQLITEERMQAYFASLKSGNGHS
jgi:hypothetical protein